MVTGASATHHVGLQGAHLEDRRGLDASFMTAEERGAVVPDNQGPGLRVTPPLCG